MKYLKLLLISSIIISCSKKDSQQKPSQPEPEIDALSYYPMAIGNYWIYDIYEVDTNGNETLVDNDSIYIKKDTLLNGYNYFVQKTTLYNGTNIIRDSSDYLVNEFGTRIFGPKDNSDTLDVLYWPPHGPDTTVVYRYKMNLRSKIISVPAGDFSALELIEYQRYIKGSSFVRPYSTFRAPEIGLVLFEGSYSHNNPLSIEYRLVRYKVN